MDALGKRGTPPFAHMASRYPMAPAASEVLSLPKHPFGCANSALFLTRSIRNGSRQPAAVLPPLPSNLPRHGTP